ncbi:NAD-dependent epimerase/dehydratase family protein [Streptacidiphilus sp. N1-3]|uniref:NAD-dependent epimerase/dehydratase family protein n=1 Tax=Streptacidiphilus alkalitolerans TaxID=3342712 RepID=A0ABV6X7C7_9ACTN
MNVILFGATGMIGQGVLRECLQDPRVERVLVVGRTAVDAAAAGHPKLREIVRPDLTDLSGIEAELADYDACFFCLGVSSVGMKEDAYRRVTYDLTLSVARTLVAADPGLTFVYVSGQGTDSSEAGRSMWARVKGKTENDLLELVPDAYMFRPGFVQPMDGVVSKTRLYRIAYAITGPLIPLFRRLAPNAVNDNRQIGRAMIAVAESGSQTRVLSPREISARAAAPSEKV